MTRHSLLIRDAEADVLREATHEEIIRAARSCLARRVVKGAVLQSPGATRDFILVELSERSHESFCVLYLDLCGAIIYVQCGPVAAEGGGFRAVWST